MTTKPTNTHRPAPTTEPLSPRLSEGLGAGAEARYLRPWQVYCLCALGTAGGVLCFWLWAGAPGLSPFVGMLVGVFLPFAGAIVAGAK